MNPGDVTTNTIILSPRFFLEEYFAILMENTALNHNWWEYNFSGKPDEMLGGGGGVGWVTLWWTGNLSRGGVKWYS